VVDWVGEKRFWKCVNDLQNGSQEGLTGDFRRAEYVFLLGFLRILLGRIIDFQGSASTSALAVSRKLLIGKALRLQRGAIVLCFGPAVSVPVAR
jgi:hypothetical protein